MASVFSSIRVGQVSRHQPGCLGLDGGQLNLAILLDVGDDDGDLEYLGFVGASVTASKGYLVDVVS